MSKTANCTNCTKLEQQVAQARREGMEAAAKIVERLGAEGTLVNGGFVSEVIAAAIRRANSGVSLSRGGNSGASGLVWPEQRAAEEGK